MVGSETKEFSLSPFFAVSWAEKSILHTMKLFISFVLCLSFSPQVEQLFCLGLKSRMECHKILEMCDWNLELASTHLLDTYGSVKQR